MIRLLVGVAAGAVTLALLLSAARWLGGVDDPPVAVAMLDTGPCAQPCWQGIQPGKTTLDQVAEIVGVRGASTGHSIHSLYSNELCWKMSAAPHWRGCARRQWDTNPGTSIKSIELEPPAATLRLGDLVMILGEPVASRLCLVPRKRSSPEQQIMAHVYFRHNIFVLADNPLQPNEPRLDPAMAVRWIFYYAPSAPLYDDSVPPWRGFSAPFDARYCGV
jgi:hypothetical protein